MADTEQRGLVNLHARYERKLTLPVPADTSPAAPAPHGDGIMLVRSCQRNSRGSPEFGFKISRKPASVMSPNLRGVEGVQLLYIVSVFESHCCLDLELVSFQDSPLIQ